MIEPLSKTRCDPSRMAGMRPFGLIFKNHLGISLAVEKDAGVIVGMDVLFLLNVGVDINCFSLIG